jgi:hypothetical protein
MTLILMHHRGRPNGVLTSMIDLYMNLRKHTPVKLKISVNDVGQFVLLCKRNHYFGCEDILTFITSEVEFEADTIITSTKTLYDPVVMECNKMIMVDSLDIMRAHCGLIPIIQPVCDDTLFLCNPTNIELIDNNFKSLEYYHKFSPERLRTIKTYSFVYKREAKKDIQVVESIFFENIGKIIFETLYTGNSVYYHGDDYYDGLHYYLNLFDIDGTKDHIPLNISKEQIEEHLFMGEDDVLLTTILNSKV